MRYFHLILLLALLCNPISGCWARNRAVQECTSEACKRKEEGIGYLIDSSVDPCEDFFQYACSSKKRGTEFPYAREDVTFNITELIIKATGDFSFLNDFYQSCVTISTQFSIGDVATYCLNDNKCPKEELAKFGSIYLDFQQHVKYFANETSWPVLTENWENKSKHFFNGEGFSWHKFSEVILKQEYYLGAFQYVKQSSSSITENFFSNVYFAPMIDHAVHESVLYERKKQYTSKIHIVPMTFPKFLVRNNTEDIRKYEKIMMSVMKLLGADDAIAENDMKKVIENEMKLAKLSKYEYEYYIEYYFESGGLESLEEVTLDEMNELLPKINWIEYINIVFRNPNVTVDGSEKVLIPGKERMKNMYNEINKMSTREQSNLMLWRIFAKFAANFFKTGNEEGTIYENIFDTQGTSTSRSDNCVNQIKTFFPNILDDLTINNYLLPEEKENIKNMFKDIKVEFANIIDTSQWMKNKTKVEAHKKLSKMEINVGEIYNNVEHLQETLSQMKVDDYISNIKNLGNSFWSRMVKSLRTPKDAFSGESVDNAFYWAIFNQVQINVGLIKGSGRGYSKDLPRALMYGGFTASVLGHELTHGFDDDGSQYDGDGEWRNWWDDQSKMEYEKKIECMIEQYNNFTIDVNGTKYNINGNDTIGENIADNGGIKIGYRAFLKANAEVKEVVPLDLNLTAQQLFWVGNAQYYCLWYFEEYRKLGELIDDHFSLAGAFHAPEPWRVNTVMSNQKEFAQDFQCPAGAKLNPAKRCVVW